RPHTPPKPAYDLACGCVMASSTHLPGVQGQCCVRHIRTWTSLRVEGASRLPSGFIARSTGNAATTTADLATARAPAAAAAGATPLPPEADPAAAARFLNGRVQQLCLDLGITRHTAWRLASAYPDLTPEQLEHRASHLSSCLSLDAETVCVLAVKERGLVTRAPADLAAALAALGQVMGGLTSMEASKVVVYSPGLLALSAPQLHQQAAALQQALGCGEEPVAALIRQQPYLLTTPTAAVAGRVNQLASTLQLSSREQAVALLTAYPPLVRGVVEEAGKLRLRLDGLRQLLGADAEQASHQCTRGAVLAVVDLHSLYRCPAMEVKVLAMVLLFPPILLTHQDITGARLQLLADTLAVEQCRLAPLLLACPTLFSVPQNQLVGQLNKLFAYFEGETKEAVLALLAANPNLLGLQQ
ncbi:hypothetical protein QJQ45_016827, partial [Haematococcus lacustris]